MAHLLFAMEVSRLQVVSVQKKVWVLKEAIVELVEDDVVGAQWKISLG